MNITSDGHGVITPTGNQTVNNGVASSISAAANSGYVFAEWRKISGSGTVVFDNPYSTDTNVTVTCGDATIQAVFAKILPYDTWVSGNVPAGGSVIYYLPAEASSKMDIATNGNVTISTYKTDRTTSYFTGLVNESKTITALENGIFVIVQTNSSSAGNFSIKATAPYNIVTISASDNGSVTPNSINLQNGTSTSITATPDPGCLFVNWTKTTGDGTVEFNNSEAATAIVKVTGGDATILANFIVDTTIQYPLTITKSGNGSTSQTGIFMVNNGVETNISATPDPGYHFTSWTVESSDGTVVFTDPSKANTTITITSGKATIRANFELNQYNLTILGVNGAVSPGPSITVYHGVPVTISVTPRPKGGYWSHWSKVDGTGTVVFGDPSAAQTTVTVTDGDATIQANCIILQYQLTTTNDGNGTVTPSGTMTINSGEAYPISATCTNSQLTFNHWSKVSGDGEVVIDDVSAANTNVNVAYGNATIQAVFGMDLAVEEWTTFNITPGGYMWLRFKSTPGKQYALDWCLGSLYSCISARVSAYQELFTHSDLLAYFENYSQDVYHPGLKWFVAQDDYVYVYVKGDSPSDSGLLDMYVYEL